MDDVFWYDGCVMRATGAPVTLATHLVHADQSGVVDFHERFGAAAEARLQILQVKNLLRRKGENASFD